MQDRCLANTNLIVNVAIVILTLLKWNFRLEAFLIVKPSFWCKSPFQLEKVHFKWKKAISTGKSPFQMEKVHLNWKKSISTGKSPFKMEF